jgi:hypothetical protein
MLELLLGPLAPVAAVHAARRPQTWVARTVLPGVAVVMTGLFLPAALMIHRAKAGGVSEAHALLGRGVTLVELAVVARRTFPLWLHIGLVVSLLSGMTAADKVQLERDSGRFDLLRMAPLSA